MRTLFALLLLLCATLPAAAERLVSKVSRDEVAITSSYTGETLTLFGSIEPEAGSTAKYVEGPFHIIITVTGPTTDRVTREKTNVFGVWLNTAQAEFEHFPTLYQVLSDAKLSDITDPVTLAKYRISLISQAYATSKAGWWNTIEFSQETVRLMEKNGRMKLNEQGVLFLSDTFYSAQAVVPADAVPGLYIAHTYLFKNGQLIAEKSDGFTVRKIGFERFLGQAAHQQPLLYGLVCVMLALFTGWLGGVVFKR
jgi:uncharacterized protein (TIGR02186 family)